MDKFSVRLSEKISKVYHCVSQLEEKALKSGGINLSVSEIHLLSVVKSSGGGLTLSDLAQELGVKRPSATVAVNKLVTKGYLHKSAVESDGRAVMIQMTAEGKRVCLLHKRCQEKVILELGQELSSQERDILLKAVDRIDYYFSKTIKE